MMSQRRYPEYTRHSPEKYPFIAVPKVTLLAHTLSTLSAGSFDPDEWNALNAETTLAGQAARTCYSPNLLTPLDYLAGSEKQRRTTDHVVQNTRESGHHSTREHVHYTFGIEGISRLAIHQVLHSYPFHVSDQQSQRYVEMAEENLIIPPLANHRETLFDAAADLFAGYREITSLLTPTAKDFLLERFPARKNEKWAKKIESEAKKKAQEVARYLLPLAMGANLYHTVSALTLMRYHRLAQTYSCSTEVRAIIGAMVEAVVACDPDFAAELSTPLEPAELPQTRFAYDSADAYHLADKIDSLLEDRPALLDHQASPFLSPQLGTAVRLVLGTVSEKLSDREAIDLILNPAKNKLLGSVLGEITMDQLSQTMNQIHLSALISLSHSADSQLQRHRGFTHTQPLHLPIPRLEQDIVVPALLYANPQALETYLHLQEANISQMQRLADAGVDLDTLAYLQTNAVKLRKRITGPLGHFYHWLKLRTCLNAQEEIYGIATTIAAQLKALDSIIGKHFDRPAPCGVRVRAGTKPYCSEGERYCGVPVWNLTIDQYPKRSI